MSNITVRFSHVPSHVEVAEINISATATVSDLRDKLEAHLQSEEKSCMRLWEGWAVEVLFGPDKIKKRIDISTDDEDNSLQAMSITDYSTIYLHGPLADDIDGVSRGLAVLNAKMRQNETQQKARSSELLSALRSISTSQQQLINLHQQLASEQRSQRESIQSLTTTLDTLSSKLDTLSMRQDAMSTKIDTSANKQDQMMKASTEMQQKISVVASSLASSPSTQASGLVFMEQGWSSLSRSTGAGESAGLTSLNSSGRGTGNAVAVAHLQQLSSAISKCPNGHLLKKRCSTRTGVVVTCDDCSAKSLHEPMMRCDNCDFDRCAACCAAKNRKRCPNGHTLTRGECLRAAVTRRCDACNSEVAPGGVMASCRGCNFDLCIDCV